MADCCATNESNDNNHHLVIVGGGSAAFAAATKASEMGHRVTMINDGLPIGGTCVNVGCVPSKTLIRAAESHHLANQNRFDGIESQSKVVDFGAVIAQELELVKQLRQAKYLDVIRDVPTIRVVQGRARFVSSNTVKVNDEQISGSRFLIATGATTYVPPIPGLAEVDYLTNQTAFELTALPPSMIVLGGRYIALECAQMFARFGCKVAVLQRSDRILPNEAPDLTDELTSYLTGDGIDVVTGVAIHSVSREGDEVVVEANVGGTRRQFRAKDILVTTGRTPNTAEMGLEKVGVELDDAGFIRVDETLRTAAPDILAAGDVIGDQMFVYTAAYEGALATRNALNDAFTKRDYTALPWVVFTDPQVAGVGLDEKQAIELGMDVDVSTLPMSHVPRCIAARDTRGFVRLIRDKSSDQLVGARILAPEGAELLMELSLAIKHSVTVSDLASSFHAYLTLGEAVKLAAITFGKDVSKLSCCAT